MITVKTSDLVGLLTDALVTSGRAIYVSTHRGGFGEEVGETDLLALTSSDGWVLGHTFMPGDGQLPAAWWPVADAKIALEACKVLAKKHEAHTVDIEAVHDCNADAAEAALMVTICETPALFDSDTELQFAAEAPGKYPVHKLADSLAGGKVDGVPLPSGEHTYFPSTLTAIAKVATRRKSTPWLYPAPRFRGHVVQIGNSWVGAMHASVQQYPAPGPSIDPLQLIDAAVNA